MTELHNSDKNEKAPRSHTTSPLVQQLLILGEDADEMNATAVRETIDSAIRDITEPIGKENAQQVIFDVRKRLNDLKEAQFVSYSAYFDELMDEAV